MQTILKYATSMGVAMGRGGGLVSGIPKNILIVSSSVDAQRPTASLCQRLRDIFLRFNFISLPLLLVKKVDH